MSSTLAIILCSTVIVAIFMTRDNSREFMSASRLLDQKDEAGVECRMHRILLWDKKFPFALRRKIRAFNRKNREIKQYLWREQDFLRLLTQYPQYRSVYLGYSKKIQKSDFARYLIVYHCGGTYSDHDIKIRAGSYVSLIDRYTHYPTIFFEETTWQAGEGDFTAGYAIRQGLPPSQRKETSLRVANYLFYSRPGAEVLKMIMDRCVERSELEVREPYDVLFTTGPDVVSSVVDELNNDGSFVVVPKSEAKMCFKHLSTHTWHREIAK
jgi:mannosyltransferase OCH1-like enzyme